MLREKNIKIHQKMNMIWNFENKVFFWVKILHTYVFI
jgi:hypothetical protein